MLSEIEENLPIDAADIQKRDVYARLSRLSVAEEDFESAYSYLKNVDSLNKKIYSESEKIAVIQALNQHDVERKELEFALLAQKEKDKQARIIVIAVGTILLLFALYVILLSRRKRIQAQHLAELKQLEQQHRIQTAQTLRQAEEEERKKIANKLHDEVGALLSISKLNIQQLDDSLFVADSSASSKLQTTQKLIGEISETVRNISHTLMPIALEKYGLKAGVQDLITSVQTSDKIHVEEIIEGLDDTTKWSEDLVLGTYRIIQEVINNAIKHAEAQSILVQIVELENSITIFIEDDGKGFSGETTQGLGMRLLRSNVEYLNGKIEIEGKIDIGTTVLIELPILRQGMVASQAS